MKVLKRTLTYVLLLALLSFPVIVFLKAQAITDWMALRDYTPPAEVVDLAYQDMMTDFAKHVFYVNHPDIESDATEFRSDCSQNEQTIILGCYHSNQRGIYIFDVQDVRLKGVEQVTSAHEMLHAAYDRLSSGERKKVDKMLMDYYNNSLKNQRIISTINAYKKTEPDDIVNEMHSIFGTEIKDLPPVMEDYYREYFSDRTKVVSFANAYEAEFTSRESKMKTDESQLVTLKSQIQSEETSLQLQLNQISNDRRRLDNLRDEGQIEQYNSEIPGFNYKIQAYNASVAKLRRDIAAYNQLVEDYNDIARELASLQQAIDTRFTAQATQ